jgi:hypothetical protein
MAVQRVTPYGLKEVADVYLYPAGTPITIHTDATVKDFAHIVDAGTVNPDFIFDTLKVSNIEVSSEETSATGGKGNPELISWSYSKEITFTMEDAVFSLATLDLMFGAKGVNDGVDDNDDETITVDANTFPANYHVVGITSIRNQANGVDIPFVFEIPNAKVNVQGTLTMEADGDPTTFEMTMKALKEKGTDALVRFHRVGTGKDETANQHSSNNVE